MDFSNPCERVRKSCSEFMSSRSLVTIQSRNLDNLAASVRERKSSIEWDEENWHYTGENYLGRQRNERVALYIFALDAINFCFWPNPQHDDTSINTLEYEHLATALKQIAEADHGLVDGQEDSSNDKPICEESYGLSPSKLASMNAKEMSSILTPHLKKTKQNDDEDEHLYLDNLEIRAKLWNEIGKGLLENFQGSATTFIASAGGEASKLVELILEHFPGFRDICQLNDCELYFLKRAQIFVGDINAALDLNLRGMNELTTFADYRVPQILRHYGVLEYSPALEVLVDAGRELSKGSLEEVSIRAATVTAVEELVKFLNSTEDDEHCRGEPFTAVSVDWYLWQVGERMHQQGLLKPFHKVRTQFY